jgi:hypothetical protein
MNIKRLLAFTLSFCFALMLAAQEEQTPKTTFKFGGFAKSDYIFTQYYNGAYSGAGRDFHIPSTTPVGGVDVHKYTDFHAKESRFNFDVSTLAGGKKLRAFVEMDFMLSLGGNERVSNSFNPRMRHFFLEYDKFLAGQTWSTFMVVILPDELDFIGAPEGVVFTRQPQFRVTLGDWQFALENPQTTYNLNAAANDPSRQVSESGLMPDAVGRYNLKLDFADFSFAGIVRQLHYVDGNNAKHSSLGTGVTVGGKIKVGSKNDIRFVATSGVGLGRYLALNFVNSSVIDNAGNLKPIFTMNEYVSYLHHWNSNWRSSFSLSYFMAGNDQNITGGGVNSSAWSGSGNIIYSPAKKVLFGAEAIYGYRSLANGTDGSFFRLQFSAKYAFAFKTSVNN